MMPIGPMMIEQRLIERMIRVVAARLTSAGFRPHRGDLAVPLKRAWHGSEPVCQTADGRFARVPASRYIPHSLHRTGLSATPADRPAPVPSAVDGLPLTEKEFRALFQHRRCLANVSDVRKVAAILDVRGHAMSRDELDADPLYLLTAAGRRVPASLGPIRPGMLISIGTDGRLGLDARSPDLAKMRRAIRGLARPTRASGSLPERP